MLAGQSGTVSCAGSNLLATSSHISSLQQPCATLRLLACQCFKHVLRVALLTQSLGEQTCMPRRQTAQPGGNSWPLHGTAADMAPLCLLFKSAKLLKQASGHMPHHAPAANAATNSAHKLNTGAKEQNMATNRRPSAAAPHCGLLRLSASNTKNLQNWQGGPVWFAKVAVSLALLARQATPQDHALPILSAPQIGKCSMRNVAMITAARRWQPSHSYISGCSANLCDTWFSNMQRNLPIRQQPGSACSSCRCGSEIAQLC